MVNIFFILVLILLIFNRIHVNICLMPCFFPVKNRRKKMYLYTALLMQKGHVKCTVAPNEAYRPSIFVLNFG